MTNRTFTPVRGRVARVTELDGCGRLKPGPCAAIVTEGIVTIGATARQIETEAITVTNFNGKQCASDTQPPRFDGWTVNITFCAVDPELFSKLTGQPVEYDHLGHAVGFRTNSDVDASKKAFSLEVWSDIPSEECDEESLGEGLWFYSLWAFLKGGSFGDWTIENGAVTFTVNGAQTRKGGKWGAGPYDVLPQDGGLPGPLLTPWASGDHYLGRLTDVAPPEPGDCIASGPPAASATAGTPGTWGPVDSYPPADLEELQDSAPTASPTAAWSTGQYVVLGDGSTAHWSGSAWVAGIA